jgi:hypothetical protein
VSFNDFLFSIQNLFEFLTHFNVFHIQITLLFILYLLSELSISLKISFFEKIIIHLFLIVNHQKSLTFKIYFFDKYHLFIIFFIKSSKKSKFIIFSTFSKIINSLSSISIDLYIELNISIFFLSNILLFQLLFFEFANEKNWQGGESSSNFGGQKIFFIFWKSNFVIS